MSVATFTVPGAPRGKGRHRFNRHTGRAYTDSQTVSAEQRIHTEWIACGRPTFDGPVFLSIEVILERPAGHYKTTGALSAAGTRSVWPTRKPDWDNVGKLVGDALNGLAYTDDAQIVEGRVHKRWARDGEEAHLAITLAPMAPPTPALRAVA